ncbi:hypothetical protein DAPPUDRAFT_344778 [Daphnia pulex]|uniref:Uncharacterized protein n=1 Tax=Daphnia pulex TaxID=6669 RepID=E9I730_DAPPU|nr:hypothetical protein DAPPUDRAFT_344778 [Daphnia pulex]|eukprot:EFX60200.1 hypothetical protein DAPPUDRAFT_344778 [Daphnia pulex]
MYSRDTLVGSGKGYFAHRITTRWPCLIASPPAESPFAKSPFAQGDDFTDEFTEKEEDLLDGLGSSEEKFEDEEDIG